MNSRSIHGPPNSPGGRLMPCTTIKSASTPGGRASKFGEATCLALRINPLSTSTRTGFLSSSDTADSICDNRAHMNATLEHGRSECD